MENKVKGLEASNRLLRLKVLSIPETSFTNQIDDSAPQQPYPPRLPVLPDQSQNIQGPSSYSLSHGPGSSWDGALFDLNQRLTSLEMRMMENRLSNIEQQQRFNSYAQFQSQPYFSQGVGSAGWYQPATSFEYSLPNG